ncbi:MAG: hypothetical protein JKX71_01785 [Amylibacter sp.]|nr:hypothetical protein [Amylibacter sp.]
MTYLNNQIVGLIRFSYLAQSGGWNIKKPMGQHKRQLYSAERMDLRFRLFENLTVPSMTYQTDKNFKCIVLCSSEMPEAYQERLLDIIEDHENLVYLALPPMPHHVAISEAFEMLKDDSFEYFTSFRLDDDDMLQKTYIETLKNKIEMAKGLIDPHTPMVTSFNFGIFLERTAQGNRIYDVTERTPGAQGTAMTTHISDTRNIFSRNHRKLPAFFKTVSHIDTPVWLRTVHSNNIANPTITGRHHLVEAGRVAELLDMHFGLTVEQVMALTL